jgi:hypothetical protein
MRPRDVHGVLCEFECGYQFANQRRSTTAAARYLFQGNFATSPGIPAATARYSLATIGQALRQRLRRARWRDVLTERS